MALDLGPLPARWLPDESLFSWVCRYQRIAGISSSREVAARLFGHARFSLPHDLPARLDEFEERTGGKLGGALEVATKRTLTRFYLPLATEAGATALHTTATAATSAHTKLAIGILTTGVRAHHPLKACPGCILEDEREFGLAYWHLDHQFPGNWICARHVQVLHQYPRKSNGVDRFGLYLPGSNARLGESAVPELSVETVDLLLLSDWTTSLPRMWGTHRIDRVALSGAIRTALECRGWITERGQVRQSQAILDLMAFCQRFDTLPESAAFPTSDRAGRATLTRLLGRPFAGAHPLRWIALLAWLFESPAAFREALRKEESLPSIAAPQNEVETHGKEHRNPARSAQIVELVESGISVRSAARSLGMNIHTALEAVAAADLRIARRPKKLDAQLVERALALARAGESRADIATQTGLSVPTIGRLLRSNPEVEAARQAASLAAERERRRNAWIKLRREHPGLSKLQIRLEAKGTYAWLYRHDRAWLDDDLSNAPSAAYRPAHPHVDWEARDDTAVALIQQAALKLSEAGQAFSVRGLRQVEPRVVPHLSSLQRLPRASRALDIALSRQD